MDPFVTGEAQQQIPSRQLPKGDGQQGNDNHAQPIKLHIKGRAKFGGVIGNSRHVAIKMICNVGQRIEQHDKPAKAAQGPRSKEKARHQANGEATHEG